MKFLSMRSWATGGLLALSLAMVLFLGSASALCGPNQQSDYCSENYGLRGDVSTTGGRMTQPGADYPAISGASLPVSGQLVYTDFKALEAQARDLLRRNLNFRQDISPYRGDNSFDELVRKFDAASGGGPTGFNKPSPDNPNLTLQQRINIADAELRQARDLYAYLAVFGPETRFRADGFYNGAPPVGYPEALCGNPTSKENPDPLDPQHTGQVLDPIIDWCDFPARLRQSVAEAANIRMIFGQQFMVDALGLHFSGTEFYGGETFVIKEVAKLRAAKHQYELAEMGLAEAMTRVVGNGCVVSDFYTQNEWSLLSRAAENQSTAQHHIAIRQSYLNINQPSDVPKARANAEAGFRLAAMDGYVKMARMAGMTTNPAAGFGCAQGISPDAQLASDMAINLQETRRKAAEMNDGRNIFGFDVHFTPARPYYTPPNSQDRGLWNEAMDAVATARDLEKDETQNSRAFDQTQEDLRNSINQLKTTLDIEISNDLSCSHAGAGGDDAEFFSCAQKQIEELQRCLDYVPVEKTPPTKPIPGITTFDQCMDRRDGGGALVILEGSGARQALFELRGAFLEQYSIEKRAENINQRIQNSNERNATVTKWLGISGAARTAADVSAAMLDTIAAQGGVVDFHKNVAANVVGGINVVLQAVAGALSTAADIEIENAQQNEEIKNLLLDQSELLIDSLAAGQAFRAKYVEFMGILGHMDDVINEAQRQRAYLNLSPGNDPSYRIIRDSKRLELAKQLEYAARVAYLTARRAEYEYGARLSASNFRISDIYRARTSGDIKRFLEKLKSTTDNLAAGTSSAAINPSDFHISVAQQVLGLTDDTLAKEGFVTPEAAQAERVRRFRLWVAQNTVSNSFEPPYDNKPVLRFNFTTSLLNGGVFSNVIQQGYDRYWLLKLAGIGDPKPSSTGLSINLLTDESGLSYRTLSMTQSGITHLKAQSGCVFDYRLMPPAVLLGLEWPSNQPPEQATAVFKGNVNAVHDWTENGYRTPAFLGRPVSATGWQVMLFAGAPQAGMKDMDLQQLTDIELNFSTTYASRTPGSPQPSDCTRIDY
ncbi:MAG: hypothetical protein J5I90_02455 [Caldilineales bacterium]|nr:hypothetical protein [Caldilineales bacterium]